MLLPDLCYFLDIKLDSLCLFLLYFPPYSLIEISIIFYLTISEFNNIECISLKVLISLGYFTSKTFLILENHF